MNCRRVQRWLSDEHDGEPAGRAPDAAAHLRTCPACRRFQQTVAAIQGQVCEIAGWQPDARADLRQLALARWSGQRLDPWGSLMNQWRLSLAPWTRSRPAIGAAAGVIAVAALAALWWGRHGTSPAHRSAAGRAPSRSEQIALPPAPEPGPRRDAPTRRITQGPGRSSGGAGAARARHSGYTSQPFSANRLVAGQDGFPGLAGERGMRLSSQWRRAPSSEHDDLTEFNRDPKVAIQQWARVPRDAWAKIEARVHRHVLVRDDFVQIPFPRIASVSDRQVAESVEGYKREAAVVDARLAREVTCAFKATALSDLCDQLRSETGISLTAGPSVADEKVTVLCERMPLREVMRQLSRPFGFTWLRSKKERGEYRYELIQDLRSQLLEEELRNRDRDAALIAVDQEMQKYRPYLQLTPNEALERLKTARAEEKKLLETIANNRGGWGPLQMYFRLSAAEQAALRAGQKVKFQQDPGPGDHPLPADLRSGIFQTWRDVRVARRPDGFSSTDESDPEGLPLTAVPEARAWLFLELHQALGQFSLSGASGYFTPATTATPRQSMVLDGSGPLAVGRSPAALAPENAVVNAKFARDPALRPRVTVADFGLASMAKAPERRTSFSDQSKIQTPGTHAVGDGHPKSKITSADVLEALHRATGIPIVADYYTRLFKPETVSVTSQPLFDALNHLCDAMRVRWNREGSAGAADREAWLQFRSTTFYDDRHQEVPNRLLARWQASRRQHGVLTLEDLVEIAQLPEEQLGSLDMLEGARDYYGLAEWDLFRNPVRHPYWRSLGEFTPAQREKMTTANGLPFTEMTLAQQQRFLAIGLEWDAEPLHSLDELAGAALRVQYTVPGWYEWQPPGPDWLQWVVPVAPGREGRRAPRAPVVERTRESALEAARRLFPSLREGVAQAAHQADPKLDEAQIAPQAAQIVPTKLLLAMVHIPGAANRRRLHVVRSDWMGWTDTW